MGSLKLQARSAEEGRSFLSRKGGGTLVGDKLFPESITLRTDPSHKLYSACPGREVPDLQVDRSEARSRSEQVALRANASRTGVENYCRLVRLRGLRKA